MIFYWCIWCWNDFCISLVAQVQTIKVANFLLHPGATIMGRFRLKETPEEKQTSLQERKLPKPSEEPKRA